MEGEDTLTALSLKDGEVLRVTLSAVADDALHVNQRVGGGSMSYSVRRELIDQVHIQR